MQALLPTGPCINFTTSGTAVTKNVPSGNVLEFVVTGTDVYVTVSDSVVATTADPTLIWQNKLLLAGSITVYRRGTYNAMKVSIIATSGGTGTVQVTPGEGI